MIFHKHFPSLLTEQLNLFPEAQWRLWASQNIQHLPFKMQQVKDTDRIGYICAVGSGAAKLLRTSAEN